MGIQNILGGIVGLTIVVLALVRKPKRPSGNSDDKVECEVCGYDVRGGLLRCPECGSSTAEATTKRLEKLREDWPNESLAPRSPNLDEYPVVVLTTDHSQVASLLKQHLEARGIRAELSVPSIGGLGAYKQAVTSHRLSVWSDDKERAEAIIAHLWPSEDDSREDATRLSSSKSSDPGRVTG